MIAMIVVFLIIFSILAFVGFRTLNQNEFLLVGIGEGIRKLQRRLEEMASKADLEAKLAEVAAAIDGAFQALTDTLTAEIQQVKDAIANAGTNNAAVIAALDTMEANLKAKSDSLSTGISDIVTPEP